MTKNREIGGKFRVAVISTYFPDYRDAVFCRLAACAGVQFVFLSGSPPPGSFIRASEKKSYTWQPIKILSVPIARTRNRLSIRSGLISVLIRRCYDVVITTNDILGPDIWLCCLLSRVLRIPVCIWGQGLSRPPSRLRDGLRYALTSLATAAIYYSEGGRDYWVKHGIPHKKLFVAYNALDTDKQILIRDQTTPKELAAHLRAEGLAGKKVFTCLGRLIAEKKPWVFIDAVASAAAQNPNIVGVLIGDGPERPALEQYVREKALTEHIRFVGELYDEPTMAKFLMSSVAVILPAAAGLAIQHAAVYGTPLILGDIPKEHLPEQEIVEEGRTGLWCPDEDVEAFAAAILRLVRDPAYRDSLSANVKREIDEKYNVARMAQGFVDAIHYCLGK